MNKVRVAFFLGLLVVVIAIARHNSPPKPRENATTSTSPQPRVASSASTPAPQIAAQSPAASATPAPRTVDFQKPVERIAPAVALISTFDASGKFLRAGSGCFISEDGRLLTSADVLKGAAHAVAKVSDGRILNVNGLLATAPALDVALLKVETQKGVPFIAPNEAAKIDNGIPLAVVGSALMHRKPPQFDRAVTTRGSDAAGEWFGLSAAVPNDCTGAPIINERGELVGIVTAQHPEGASAVVGRSVAAAQSIIAHIDPKAAPSWQVAATGELVAPPAEGPTAPPSRTAKIPLVRADQPGMTKLIYSPKPRYPGPARGRAAPAMQGEGRYRVRFAANGQVQDVEVLQSTHNPALDSAATQTLRTWKATPGREWSATVPISFTP
jgi:TonB family protein